jgi:hypothetical protein
LSGWYVLASVLGIENDLGSQCYEDRRAHTELQNDAVCVGMISVGGLSCQGNEGHLSVEVTSGLK